MGSRNAGGFLIQKSDSAIIISYDTLRSTNHLHEEKERKPQELLQKTSHNIPT